jgi:TonB family protein
MIHRRIVALLMLALVAFVPGVASAQDAFSKAKGFYESAEYEEALNLLDTMKGKTGSTEVAAYRVFCLVALGRNTEAKAAVTELVQTDPLFRPTEAQVSPRLRTFFEEVRKPLLPDVARQRYSTAKAAFDQKSWQAAIAEFDRVITLLGEIGAADQGATDLRTLAMGFRDLAKSAAEPPKPAVTESAPAAAAPPPPAPVKPAEPVIYGAQHSDVKKPVAMSKPMPEWRPASQTEQKMIFEGALEFVVGEDGKVISVRLLESVHQAYDAALLKQAMNWSFKPATKNGVPVRYRYAVSIRLGG